MEWFGVEGLKIIVVEACWGGGLPGTGKTPKQSGNQQSLSLISTREFGHLIRCESSRSLACAQRQGLVTV